MPKTRTALEHWQNKKIEKHLKKIIKKSPFYAQRLKQYKKWQGFPVINKQVFMENFDSINTQKITKKAAFQVALQAEESRNFSPMIGNITVGLSSGTSGNRGIFLASIEERAQWVAYVLVHVLGLSLQQQKVAFFLRANSNLYSAAKSKLIDFNFFDLKAPVVANLEELNLYQPNILVAQPSMLIQIAQAQQAGTIAIQPSKIIAVAEVLEPSDHSLLKRVFKQVIHQAYQCTEGFLAKTCAHGTLHFNEDIVKIEKRYLDENKERYHPIITDFTRSSQPIFRYELNDIIIDRKTPCPCGSIHQAIDHIEGRSDDIFVLTNKKGEAVKIFPDFLRRAVISASNSIQAYLVEQIQIDKIKICLESPNFEQDKTLVKKAFQDLFQHYEIENYTLVFDSHIPIPNTNKLRRIKRSC